MYIWHSADIHDKRTQKPIRGQVTLIQSQPRLGIILNDNGQDSFIELDDILLKFGYAIQSKDLGQCLRILEG